jgi:Bifunctional DNA primase/polymerase, N-terminal
VQLLNAALEYYAQGWSVFPVDSDKKSSQSWKAQQQNALEPKALTIRFQDARAVGVAVACGALSNVTVIDLEGPYLEHEAIKNLIALAPPDMPRARSGGGGVHLFFAHTGERNASIVSSDGEHLGDIRGEGGYLICPPSTHQSGRAYTWETKPSGPLPMMPEKFKAALLQLLKKHQTTLSISCEGNTHVKILRSQNNPRGTHTLHFLENLDA